MNLSFSVLMTYLLSNRKHLEMFLFILTEYVYLFLFLICRLYLSNLYPEFLNMCFCTKPPKKTPD